MQTFYEVTQNQRIDVIANGGCIGAFVKEAKDIAEKTAKELSFSVPCALIEHMGEEGYSMIFFVNGVKTETTPVRTTLSSTLNYVVQILNSMVDLVKLTKKDITNH